MAAYSDPRDTLRVVQILMPVLRPLRALAEMEDLEPRVASDAISIGACGTIRSTGIERTRY